MQYYPCRNEETFTSSEINMPVYTYNQVDKNVMIIGKYSGFSKVCLVMGLYSGVGMYILFTKISDQLTIIDIQHPPSQECGFVLVRLYKHYQ